LVGDQVSTGVFAACAGVPAASIAIAAAAMIIPILRYIAPSSGITTPT